MDAVAVGTSEQPNSATEVQMAAAVPRRFVFEPRHLVLHAALFAAFLLWRFLGVHLALASLVLVPVPLIYWWRPRWVAKRGRRLDRDLLRLAQLGRSDELMPRYQQELGLRLAADRSYLGGKLGFVHAELGHPSVAARWYRRAAETAPTADDRRRLKESLAAAEAAAGDDEEAEGILAVLVTEGRISTRSAALLGRLLVAKEPLRAIRLLERAVSEMAPGRVRTAGLRDLARAYRSAGDATKADAQLARAAAELEADDAEGRADQQALLALFEEGPAA